MLEQTNIYSAPYRFDKYERKIAPSLGTVALAAGITNH